MVLGHRNIDQLLQCLVVEPNILHYHQQQIHYVLVALQVVPAHMGQHCPYR